MLRNRFRAVAAGLALTLAAVTLSSAQGPGGGGRGGRGGGMMFGGPGGNRAADLLQLVQDPSVQEELALSDKQKEQIKAIREQADRRGRELRDSMRKQGGPGGRGGQGGGPGGGFGGFNPGGGPPDPGQMQAFFARMQQTQATMQAENKAALGKILTSKQANRLYQISLQLEGPTAVTRPEVAQKLRLTEQQLMEIEQVRTGSQVAQRELFSQMRGMFGGGRGGPGAPGGPGNAQGTPAGPGGATKGQQARPGGPGGGQPFDREAMREYFQSEEFKTQRAKMDEQREAIQDKMEEGIGKVLTKYQRASFNKMLGEKFDTSKMRGFGGPGGGPGGNNRRRDDDDNDDEKSEAKTERNAQGGPQAKTDAATTEPAKPAGRSLSGRRKSDD